MLKLYNTATRRKELFRPLVEGKVGIYTCGPTVHDLAHIGLLRRLLTVDVLKRMLRSEGYEVRHVVNVTDVDDKTIEGSARAGVRLEELTGRFADAFFEDADTLRILPADVWPRATAHVDEMVAMTRRLVEKGVAYEMQRSVYFDISKFPGYGKLSRVDPAGIRAGATVDLDYYEKDEARDFTLFRRSDLGELRRRITWATDWGNVRPSWHIECAAMATKYLGERFDIHTSGQDLVFPHNENENAICECLSGKPMARWWVHTGLMQAGGRKMSRSAGSALTLRDLQAKGYAGRQVRYALLMAQYRRHMDFSIEGLDAACRELARLDKLVMDLRQVRGRGGPHREVDDVIAAADRAVFDALGDDLNVPVAKARLFDLLKELNARMALPGFSLCDADLALDLLWRVDRVLGVLDFEARPRSDERVDALLAEREAARQAGDYARADAIREQIAAMGVRVEDTIEGARIRHGRGKGQGSGQGDGHGHDHVDDHVDDHDHDHDQDQEQEQEQEQDQGKDMDHGKDMGSGDR